jgi:hypothetical protein
MSILEQLLAIERRGAFEPQRYQLGQRHDLDRQTRPARRFFTHADDVGVATGRKKSAHRLVEFGLIESDAGLHRDELALAGLRVADVTGPEKIEQLRKVMLQRARKALAPDIKVVGIWPEEWIVQ